jgi:alkanesulfonate monooxygenase
MTSLAKTFGVAARNFTAYPEMPNARKLVEYGVRVEELGYDSVWVWDHVLLGVEPNFPIIDSLTVLTGIAARTRRIKLGTGVLVLPLRDPVTLAKQLSSMDQLSEGRMIMGMASGWYKREFDAVGIPFDKRGKLMDENLEIMIRLWTEEKVSGKYSRHDISAAVMYKIRNFAREGGKDPDALMNASQLPIIVGASREAVRDEMMDWLNKEWDFPAHSDCSRESAIMGTIDECVAQLREHLAVGVQKIIFVPYKYREDQIETIAREIIPRLKAL